MATQTVLLWLAGWGMSNDLWHPIQVRFPTCQQVTPDFTRATDPKDFMAVIEKEVRAVDHGRLLVIGWSMGGVLAQRLAANAPVHGMVLISTGSRFVRPKEERSKGWPKASLLRMERGLIENRERVWGDFFESIATEKERRVQKDTFLASRVNEWPTEALMAGLAYLREEDCGQLCGSLDVPVTIIHGKNDAIWPFAAGAELAESLAQAELVPIEDCGHAPPVFYPEIVTLAVQRMVESDGEGKA
ncbi:alpha/beta fold hydrolase [Brevibacillus nitrificans]|uniref:alpha/beta fold hydrolase n=1 Tax=Brevibacillus nitrificans TaxID=651560 RepID=UPI002638A6A4|nr:alpha/beta hydrolase [Brevibacillus nitrificans]